MTEDETVGWHHWLNGREFEEILGDSEGQGSRGAAGHGVTKSQTQLSDWATVTMVAACLTLWGTAKLFSPGVAPFYIPGSGIRWSPFFCFLASSCYCLFFIPAVLVGLRRCLTVVLVCIFLMMDNVGHLLWCLLAICLSSWERCLSKSFAYF